MAKICVIGSGASGLTTIKQLLDEGHTPVCLEKSEGLGGLFKYTHNGGGVYKNTILTISNYFMAFSDLPPEEDDRTHWHHSQYLDYLKRYANKYALERFIEFGKEVVSMKRKGDKWEIISKDTKSNKKETDLFDGVAICTGTHQQPNTPEIKGIKNFKGDVSHSVNYKTNAPFKDKNVVVVGIGESSADIVREIATVAKNCHLVIRSYPFVVPRNQRYEAADANTSRTFSMLSYPQNILMKLYVTLCCMVSSAYNGVLKLLGLAKKPELDSFCQSTDTNFIDHSTVFTEEHYKVIKSWAILSGATPESKFATKNATFIDEVVSGKINVIPKEIKECGKDSVTIKNGKKIPCDMIIFCTGYKDSFPFIKGYEVKDNNIRNLYMNAFHPEMENVAFIGWNRPSLGAIPACSEMMARYYALVLSKKRQLPKNIKEVIKKNKAKTEEQYKYSPNVLTIVNYHEYMTRMAELIGCEVKWSKYIFKPRMLYKLIFGSHISSQYRLFGPHNMKKSAEKVIKGLRVSPVIKNVITRVSIAHLLGLDFKEKGTHKEFINKFYLPEVKVSDEELEKYSFKSDKKAA